MKKLLIASLVSLAATSAHATDVDVTMNTSYVAIGSPTAAQNVPATVNVTARTGNVGFVKNDFSLTMSANVVMGIIETGDMVGVAGGSNKGRNVFTGSSNGGSVSQCGTPVDASTANGAASAVVSGVIVLANPNGCGRTVSST